MKLLALTLFTKLHSNGTKIPGRCLAAWHSDNSITWRWLLWWKPASENCKTFLDKDRNGITANLKVPLIGSLYFKTQPTMLRK